MPGVSGGEMRLVGIAGLAGDLGKRATAAGKKILGVPHPQYGEEAERAHSETFGEGASESADAKPGFHGQFGKAQIVGNTVMHELDDAAERDRIESNGATAALVAYADMPRNQEGKRFHLHGGRPVHAGRFEGKPRTHHPGIDAILDQRWLPVSGGNLAQFLGKARAQEPVRKSDVEDYEVGVLQEHAPTRPGGDDRDRAGLVGAKDRPLIVDLATVARVPPSSVMKTRCTSSKYSKVVSPGRRDRAARTSKPSKAASNSRWPVFA